MKTLLIVEDEKAIRRGLAAMALRAPVEISEVIECRDGAEALAVLERQDVDVMITDIRMPKMDGLELVRRASALPNPPLTVVVSGYDDFSYAVEVFRCGVRDYILKPIEREKLVEALVKLDGEVRQNRENQSSKLAASAHVVRGLMLDGGGGEETGAILQQYGDVLFQKPYVVFCLRPGAPVLELAAYEYSLPQMEGQWILLAGAAAARRQMEDGLRGICFGASRVHEGAGGLRAAYLEAVKARGAAFARGTAAEMDEVQNGGEEPDIDEQLWQIVHLLGAGSAAEAKQVLGKLLILAQNGRMAPGHFTAGMVKLLGLLEETYGPGDEGAAVPKALWAPMEFENALGYYTELCRWMDEFGGRALPARTDENERKIHEATLYLRENFGPEVDMALVSNVVSMNYSQFSLLFKQVTGTGFQDYIKNLRLAEAKRLLRDTDLLVKDVSERAGFRDEKHFMKVFKQSCGVPPGDYRRNLRAGGAPEA